MTTFTSRVNRVKSRQRDQCNRVVAFYRRRDAHRALRGIERSRRVGGLT